jgi:3',5'-cyclic AMP phosphodiesterase CpdA
VKVERRSLLKGAAFGAGALAFGALPAVGKSQRNGFRAVFFTDAHLPAEMSHPERLPNDEMRHQERGRRAFELAAAEEPDLVIFGGDNVFAIDQQNSRDNAEMQFANWNRVVDDKLNCPTISVIGNHDIWVPGEGVPVSDRKAFAKVGYQMPHRYYRHDAGGWSFFLLDVFGTGATEGLDEEQWAWFEGELASTDKPCCVVTHAPILSATNLLVGGAIGGTNRFRETFLRNPQVRLALSGHNHCVDRVEYDEVTYICGGAVSGAWWGGNYAEFPPAFVVLDLQPDGTLESEVVFWETAKGAPPLLQKY